MPYTLWHLSYVVIGAALAPQWLPGRLLAALAAFALALGVGAHALDELNGRPLRTGIPDRVLWALALLSVGGALGIGFIAAWTWWRWLLVFVAFGGFAVVAYNLELLGGRFHTDTWFALSWGAFPLLTANAAAAEAITWAGLAGAAFAALLSYAQRRLSAPVRALRRRVVDVSGRLELDDGSTVAATLQLLTDSHEAALRALATATVVLAIALVVARA